MSLGSTAEATPEQQQAALYHALAGLCAHAGHDVVATQSEEEREIYRVVGAGLVWELMQEVKSLNAVVRALVGVKR